MGGVFVGMDKAIMTGLNQIVQGQMSLYSTMMAGLVTGSVTLYILLRGYQTLAGKLITPVEDTVWDLARMGIILVFVTNVDGYLDATVAAIHGLKDGFSGSDNVWVLLDTLWAKAQDIGQQLYNQDQSTYVKMNGGIAELLVWGGTMFTLIVATIVNLAAEMILLLMTTTAPIFIFCLMYGFLRPMFNNWLQTIFTVILTLMFSALMLRIAINYLASVLSKSSGIAAESNMVTLGAQCCLAAVGAGVTVWISYKIASALGGASVQGAIQGMAKMGLGAVGSAATRGAGSAGKDIAKHGPTALNAAGKGIDYVRGKAANAISGYMNGRELSKVAVNNMKSLNK